MNAFFGISLAVVLLLLLVVWLGPYFASWLLSRYMNHYVKAVKQFQERQHEHHDQIQAVLIPLREHLRRKSGEDR